MKSDFFTFFSWVLLDKAIKLSNRKEKIKAGTDGGLPAKPASQLLSLAWQCDIVLHVAYGV